MITILVVDDHIVIREGLKKIVGMEKDMIVKGEARDTAEALKFVAGHKVDVILLDISMPGRSGLDIIPELKQLHPTMRILMLSMYKEDEFALKAFKSGASGYLTKETAPELVVKAIRHVSAGGKYFPDGFAEKLLESLTAHSPEALHERLSSRESMVMHDIIAGKSLNEIASNLSLNNRTVSTYRARILEKLRIRTNAELIRYAVEHGLAS